MTDELIHEDQYTISNNYIEFLTFNYDRSLERYLYNSFMSLYGEVDERLKLEEYDKIKITHINGSLGQFTPESAMYKCNYGVDFMDLDIAQIIPNIKLMYTERDKKEKLQLQDWLSGFDRIFILGFAYAKENLEVLGFPDSLSTEVRIYGTALNMPVKQVGQAKKALGIKTYSRQVHLHEELTCTQLLERYL